MASAAGNSMLNASLRQAVLRGRSGCAMFQDADNFVRRQLTGIDGARWRDAVTMAISRLL